MGFFGSLYRGAKDTLRDTFKQGVDNLTHPENLVNWLPHQTAEDRRNAQNLMNEQMKAYKEQTELTRQEINNKRDQIAAEKRRVEEKQIRSLRRGYKAPGFLGGGDSSQPDMTSKLGG